VSTYNSLQAYFQRTNPKTYAICLKLIFLYSSNLVLKDFYITQTSFFVIMACNSWLLYNNILGKGIEYQAEVQNKMQKAEDENISVDAIKLHKHTDSTFCHGIGVKGAPYPEVSFHCPCHFTAFHLLFIAV